MLGVGRDGLQGFCRGLEENAVDHLLVLVGDRGDLFRHGEDHMKIRDLEKFGLPLLDPLRPGQTLAFGAVSIAAAIERIAFVAALIAAFEVAAEHGRAAHLDGGHDAPLRHRHRRAMLLSISFSVAAEHVRHFQLRTVHAARRSEVLRRGGCGLNGYGTREQVERTGCRAHLAGGNPQVAGGGRQTAMAEQKLDGADIGTGFQQVNREARGEANEA